MVRLGIKIGKLKLKNPVMAASGTFGPEHGELIDINKLGAYITKTITLNARAGNPPPRVVDTPSGMLNSIGLENKGINDFINNKLPKIVTPHFRVGNKIIPHAEACGKTALIASIAGDNEDEFWKLAEVLDKERRVDAVELNLSCPNVRHGQLDFLAAQDEKETSRIVSRVRRATNKTIIAKLSPNVTDITRIALAAEAAGADAVSLVNTFVGVAIDIDSKKPVLGNITGGLSGPAIKPIALRMVMDVYKKVKIPIIGIGGIMDYKDAMEFILCGASAIQVGTANFVNPKASIEIIEGIKKYMARNNVPDINKLIGALKT